MSIFIKYTNVLLISLIASIHSLSIYASTYQRISAPEVKQMLENNEALLVNVLSTIDFEMQHIPGSIHIPLDNIDTAENLPSDKNSPIIFHCMGENCPLSERACIKAVEKGYQKVYWFQGGIPEWRKHNYPMDENAKMLEIKIKKLSPDKFKELLDEQNPVIIDVRPENFPALKHFIKDSRNISLTKLHEDYVSLDTDRPIVVVDAFMRQSQIAAKYLSFKGYNVVGILKGGVARWEKEGFPTILKE